MNKVLTRLHHYSMWAVLSIAFLWVILALCFEVFMIVLDNSGHSDMATNIANEITWKFDGRFKNSPGNIWYEEPKSIAIGIVSNKVQIGALAGNRNLEFGVQNILEEALQDKGYDIDHAAADRIEIDIVYLDVLKTSSNMSVFHKDKESIVIRLFARYYKGDKLAKKFLVEESADEISMSTIVIDQGGKFNQQNLSSALKKAVSAVVNKL